MSEANRQRLYALTDSRVLAKNTLWNLLGRLLPLSAALLSIPPLLRVLGPDRFGILMLALTFVGYFGLLDFGIGRALTQVISERIGQGREDEVPAVVWTGLTLLVALGSLGAAAAATLAPTIIRHVVKIPAPIIAEAIAAFYMLAVSIPFVILNAALWGTLAAYQRFDLSNRLSIPLGIANYVGPLIILQWFDSLVAVMAVLLAARIVACAGLSTLAARAIPGLRRGRRFDGGAVRRLVTFGGWHTLSNIMTPLMTSVDRFIIGGLLSVTAVSFYAAPYEIVAKLWVVPVALMSVLAPAFTVQMATRDGKTSILFQRALAYLFLVLFPTTVTIVVFAQEGLTIWLGRDFAAHSVPVLQYLAAGALFSGLAQVPMVIMTSFGRPDITAKLQLLEVPLYLPILFGVIALFGIVGAAAAWAIRMMAEAVTVLLLAGRFIPDLHKTIRQALLGLPLVLITFVSSSVIAGLVWKVVFECVVLAAVAVLACRIIGRAEREYALSSLRMVGARLRPRT